MKRHDIVRAGLSAVLGMAAFLSIPPVALAAPLYVTFAWDMTYGNLEFGPELGFARIVDQGLGEDERLWTPRGTFPIVGGVFNLWTGPLLDVTLGTYDAVYSHAGGGGVSVMFDLALADGSTHHGTFEASLGPYVIRPGCCGAGDGGDTEGDLGPGVFDRGTAGSLESAVTHRTVSHRSISIPTTSTQSPIELPGHSDTWM